MKLTKRNELRTIKTARDKEAINQAVKEGFRPLIKKVEPSDKIRSKYAIIRNPKTGEIEVVNDIRIDIPWDPEDGYEMVLDFTYYYPHHFTSPFAAYLIPEDIQIGERVFVEDLIEDYVYGAWAQGDTYRLEGCEAIWTGTDLEIQYDPDEAKNNIFIG